MSKTIYYQNKQIELKYGRINHLIPADMWQCGLSLQAIGVASYIYTLPKEWKLSVSHIAKQLMISPNSCRKYLREIFTNPKAIKVFKGVEREANTYDLEEGFYEYPYVDEQEEVANFTSSVAKDVSVPRKRRVLIVQTETQRYLLNLCFARGVSLRGSEATEAIHNENADSSMDRHADKSARDDDKKVDSSSEITPNKNAQNLRTIKRDSKESLKDSSSKRPREKAKDLASFLDLKAFNEKEQEAIKLWIRYKQESSKTRLKPSQIDFQLEKAKDLASFLDLKAFNEKEQEAIKLWIRYKQESSKTRLKPSQIDFQLRKIQRLKEQGQDICAVIEKSVDMGWQGLFAQRDSAFGLESAIAAPRKLDRPQVLSHSRGLQNTDSSSKILESQAVGIKPRIPKNLGGKAVLCVK